MKKTAVRKSMRFFRNNMTENERKVKDAAIRERLYGLATFKDASFFFPFVSCGSEVDTVKIIEDVLKEGKKRVGVPKVCGDEMDFFFISSLNDLKKGCMGILEPVGGEKVRMEKGVLLMPGLGFDKEKNRVGYGGGFYDKYLGKYDHTEIFKLAVAYDFQVVDCIEDASVRDIKPDRILTETRFF